MRVRVYGSPFLHVLDDDYIWFDYRLAVTHCGLVFAWTTHWPGPKPPLSRCPECLP